MSDTTTPAASAENLDFEAYLASLAAFEERASSLIAGNKGAIFDALTEAGITHVTVAFDGSSDAGQIEHIDAFSDERLVDLIEIEIVISSASWGDPGIVAEVMTLPDAIERMAFDLLGGTHDGWENSSGAYGEFCFDARAHTIQLDFNERLTSSENYAHGF